MIEYRYKMKNKEIEVNLTYYYVRIKDEHVPSDDFVTVAAKVANAVMTKKTATATFKLTKEVEIRASLKISSMKRKNALQNNHACISRKCSNYDRYY